MQPRFRGSVRWIAIFAVLALVLVACADTAEETTTTAAPAETTTTTAAPTTTTTEAPPTTQVEQEGVFFVEMEILVLPVTQDPDDLEQDLPPQTPPAAIERREIPIDSPLDLPSLRDDADRLLDR